MVESIDDLYARKAAEMAAKLKADWDHATHADSPGFNWGKAADHMRAMEAASGVGFDKASPPRPSGVGEAMAAALDHMEVLQSEIVPLSQVLVMNPATYRQFTPMSLDWPADPEPLRFKVMADYRAFALPKYRPFFQCDIAGDEPLPVKRIDEVPAPAVPAWQYAVLFAVGGLILFMLGGAL